MRFRKADYEMLGQVDALVLEQMDMSPAFLKKWSSFYERVRKNEAKPKTGGSGLPVKQAVEIIKDVLGKRCVLPAAYPLAGQVWFIQMQNKLNANGVTREIMLKAAKAAATEWKGRIRAEAVIRNVDTLLSERELEELKAEATDMEDL